MNYSKQFFLFILICIFQNLHAQQSVSFYFESDAFTLTKSEIYKLNQWIDKNQNSKILSINGFTDEDGSEGYNDTLSAKRVHYIFSQVKNKINIRKDFKKLHFGELHKQSGNKAENRRVIIFYLNENELALEQELIPEEKPAIIEEKPVVEYPDMIVITNPDGSKTELDLNAQWMKKMGETPVGEKLILKNLEFHINTFAIVNESRPTLFELLMVMNLNPTLEIEIGGHICCITKDHRNLSTDRAKAIKNFLINYGIDKNRITYKGYGSSEPLFEIPEKNEEERAANRRVEITITKR